MNALEVIISEIDKKVFQLQDAVSTGRCVSYEEYKGMCGEIKGLLTARTYVLETQQMIERTENE